MTEIGHLARRFFGSLSHAEPSPADTAWVRSQLLAGEWERWATMAAQDRRHSILVGRRFVDAAPDATRAAVAGALLHDVGKQVAGLGTIGRVVATVAGGRTTRFRAYHDHERLGAALLSQAGSEPATIELVRGAGPWATALRAADDV